MVIHMPPNVKLPYEWQRVFISALTLFLLGLTTARSTLGSSLDGIAIGLLSGIAWAIVGGVVVAIWKYFKRSPSSITPALIQASDNGLFIASLVLAAFLTGKAIYFETYGALVDATILVGLGFSVKAGIGPARWGFALYAFISPIVVLANGGGNPVIWPFVFYYACQTLGRNVTTSELANDALTPPQSAPSTNPGVAQSSAKMVSQQPVHQATQQSTNSQPSPSTAYQALPVSQSQNQSHNTAVQEKLATEEDFWATAMSEVETGQRRPGVWAKAFAECDGDETKAKVAYLKARVEQLTNAAKAQAAQEEADKLAAVEMAKANALAMEQEAERLAAQFLSTGSLSRKELKNLIEHGPRVWLATLRDSLQGNTLLHLCAENGMVEEVNALLIAGADPCRANNTGVRPESLTHSPLIRQLCSGLKVSQEQLKVLISPPMGLCPNCTDVIPAEVQTCPSCQANFGPSSSWHVTCFNEMELIGELKAIYLGKKPTLNQIKYLVAASVHDSSLLSLTDSHNYGATLLHWCAHYRLLEQAQVLLLRGANPKAKNSQGRLPFEWCEDDELRQVLDSAAKLAAAQDAALLEAIFDGNWALAKSLLESGVKPTGWDAAGRSLLDIAKLRKDTGMISLLQSYGAT